MTVKLEEMQVGEEGIKASVVIDVYRREGVNVYACVLEYLSVVLAGDLVDDILLVDARGQQRMIQDKEVPDALLIDDQKALYVLPNVEYQLVPSEPKQYHLLIQFLDRITVWMSP